MVLLDQWIAECALDTPQRQQRAALDAEVPLDAGEQRAMLAQRFLSRADAPVRDATIDVLPEFFLELRLVAHLREHAHVGLDPAHHVRVGGV